MTDLTPYAHRGVERSLGRALDRVAAQANLQRAEDHANAERAAQRISDIRTVTNHGINAATSISMELEMAVAHSPLLRDGIAHIAMSGVRAIKQQVDALGDPFA